MIENNQTLQENDDPRMCQLIAEAMLREKMKGLDVDKEWEKLLRKRTVQPRRKWLVPFYYICACAVLAALAFLPSLLWQPEDVVVYEATSQVRKVEVVTAATQPATKTIARQQPQKLPAVENRTIIVPAGMTHHLVLPDGTEVWLNAESRITYPLAFQGYTREVTMEGEAYFKVQKDARHPFIVKASHVMTRVVGTEFNVNSYQPEAVAVTLAHGHVVVSGNETAATEDCELKEPGATASLKQGSLKKEMAVLTDVTSWREGIILFDDATLRDILLHIGSWYNMTVVCHGEQALNMRLHYVYDRHQSVMESLQMLENIAKINLKVENNTIFID
ncbi:MAG: FecR domain-containing protein [Prevotellaceae bacterium]|nr:FecR domain-containing protein [Prevotellaceae bacterium]